MSPERVAVALRAKAIKEITPREVYVESEEDRVALSKAQKRRTVFNFRMVDIPVGTELIFSRNGNIKARVVDNRYVEYNGETISLSEAARRALGVEYLVQGPAYWTYEGETLDERRRRFESGE